MCCVYTHMHTFRLCEVQRIGKSAETESYNVARAGGRRERGMRVCIEFLWGDEDILDSDMVMAVELCEYPKNH